MTISKVGVVGCGLMGSGIAQVVAQSGYATTVVEADHNRIAPHGAILESLSATS